ncbi:MAG: 3-hydroxyacyl-CoA dehydrogenase NAD-binding domain-containing protein [Calditrichota bacterium]
MKYFNLNLLSDGILNVIFHNEEDEKNRLNSDVFSEIKRLNKELRADKAIRAVLFSSGNPTWFCGGETEEELFAVPTVEELYQFIRERQEILKTWRESPIPVVAEINGNCYDAGLELIAGCTARIINNENSCFAVHRGRLGIIPAYGALTKITGYMTAEKAFKLISGKQYLDSSAAEGNGLVDQAVYSEVLRKSSLEILQLILQDSKYYSSLQKRKQRTATTLNGKRFLKKIIKSNRRKNVELPDIDIAKALLQGIQEKEEDALQFIARKAAIHASSAETRCRIYAAGFEPQIPEAPERRNELELAVVGAGRIGRGIVAHAAKMGYPIIVNDRKPEALSTLFQQVTGKFDAELPRGLGNDLLSLVPDYRGFTRASIVFEAVVENADIKREVLNELSKRTKSKTILATSASTTPISKLAEKLESASRIVGVHFHYPLTERRFVEVIAGKESSEVAVGKLLKLLKQWGLTVVRSADSPGFLLNRILTPFYTEAFHLLKSGVSPERIDAAMRDFGFLYGPFQLMQKSGLAYSYTSSSYVQISFPERMSPSDLPGKLYEHNLNTEQPVTFYRNAALDRPNRAVLKFFGIKAKNKMSPEDICERLNLAMINEALIVIEEGVADGISDIEKTLIYGVGFPTERGGLLKYGESLRWRNVLSRMNHLNETVGRQFQPAALLSKAAEFKDLSKALENS